MPNGRDLARNGHELPLPQEQLNRYSNVTEAAPDSGMGTRFTVVVVVYYVTILAIGHGLLKKFWPFGTRLRSTVQLK